jgi:hypothetical protein
MTSVRNRGTKRKEFRVEQNGTTLHVLPFHQLAFDSEEKPITLGKYEPIQRTQAASSGFVCLNRALARAERGSRKAQLLPGAIGMVVFQEIVVVWAAGKAFCRPGNVGISDQRRRKGTAKMVRSQ